MTNSSYTVEFNAPKEPWGRRPNYVPQGTARRLAEQVHPYAPTRAFRRYELATTDPKFPDQQTIRGNRSLFPVRDVEATIGFRADVLCAVVQGGETFWVVDASRYHARTGPKAHSFQSPRYMVPSAKRGTPPLDLGFSGIAIVQPRVARAGGPHMGIQRLTFDRDHPGMRTHASVGASVAGAREHFNLPQDYPDYGFTVVLNNDDAGREYAGLTVIEQSGAQTEVLRPADHLEPFIGQNALSNIFGRE